MKRHIVSGVVCLLGLSLMQLACGGGGTAAPVAIAYVAHSQSHSLSVINIPADRTVSTIEIGNSSVSSLTQTASYPQAVAVTPDGSRAYVTDGSTSVWVVDAIAKSVIGTIPAGTDPQGIAITPDGKSAYFTSITCGALLCSGPSKPTPLASVEVIDTGANSLTATITFGKASDTQLSGIAISPDGTRAYVTETAGGKLWVIDTATNSVAMTISTGATTFSDVSFSPDGKAVYAIGASAGPISSSFFADVIDPQTNTVTATIALGNTEVPTKIAVAPDGGRAYVTGDAGDLWVIDTKENATVASVKVSEGNPLLGVAITPDGSRAYVTCGNNNTIYVLDSVTNRVVDTVRSDYPGGLSISRGR